MLYWKLKKEALMDELIAIDSDICSGKPVIRGTRIMVKNILGMMAGGYTVGKIISEYPELNVNQIAAALEYASSNFACLRSFKSS